MQKVALANFLQQIKSLFISRYLCLKPMSTISVLCKVCACYPSLMLCGCLATTQLNSFSVAVYLYCIDSTSGASGEKRTVQGMIKGDEESNSLKSQESNLSEDRYHSNGVSLNRSEAVVAGHYSPHSAVHFLPPQVYSSQIMTQSYICTMFCLISRSAIVTVGTVGHRVMYALIEHITTLCHCQAWQ